MSATRSLLAAAALGCVLASAVSAASPLVGKWKFNASKSKMTGTTDVIAAAGPNTWKFTYGTFSWTVKADGTDQTTPFGSTVAMKVVSPTTWQFTNKMGGKLMSNDTWELAADGQSMTRTSKGKRENGEAFNDVVKVKRTAGAKGFEGTWESTEFKGTPPEFDIEPNGEDGVILIVPAENLKITMKFDGQEYPVTGPRVPPGTTTSGKMVNPRKVTATTKMNGKALDTEIWEVSGDGRTFTYTEKDAGQSKAIVGVYDKM